MQYKRLKRRVDGVLLLDKPVGLSSNQALQKVKHLFMAAKAGHTGTLDPFATGLLPICLGEATKFSHFLLDADKTYRATLKFGATTTTGDSEGEIVTTDEVHVSKGMLEGVLYRFVGEISQTPPMYSALKHQGKALYEYARAGVEIERQPRAVKIYHLALDTLTGSAAVITVTCSKGTYIRTLAEDIGKALGCGAHLTQLRRITTGGFDLKESVTLEQLEAMTLEQRDMHVLPADIMLQHLPALTLDVDSAFYLSRGQSVWKSGTLPQGYLRLYTESGRFLGLGELDVDGKVAPRRLVMSDSGSS